MNDVRRVQPVIKSKWGFSDDAESQLVLLDEPGWLSKTGNHNSESQSESSAERICFFQTCSQRLVARARGGCTKHCAPLLPFSRSLLPPA